MPRSARQVLEGVPHHVILRGNNRRRLFSYARDYRYFISLVRRHISTCKVGVHGLCLMANHVHLLITPCEQTALAAFVKKTAQRYAQVRNKRFSSTGKLFEQRYYSKVVTSEQHLAIVTAYIDLNPVRAGIVDDGAGYAWSTFCVHAGLRCREIGIEALWSPTDWYRRLGREPNERASAYRDWLLECRARDDWAGVGKDPDRPKGGAPVRPNRSRAAG